MTSDALKWSDILGTLADGGDLTREQARAAMGEVMAGNATHAQIAAFIVALRIKGETTEEMTGLVEAMKAAAVSIDIGVPVIDIVGTGGDRSGTFNISTTASIIAAGAGAHVAKHGNRSASSRCGSADVLEALGMNIELHPEQMAQLVREERFGFLFAPLYHPAMRHAGPVRTEMGIPTVFNFLGPLANPANATRQAVGVSDRAMADRMIGVLERLGSEYAFVYHGSDGLDEITTTGPTYIDRLKDGETTTAEFTPEDFGIARASASDLLGGGVDDNVAIVRSILSGEKGPKRDVAIVNASPGLVAAGLARGFVEGTELAAAAIDSGAAAEVLDRVVRRSRSMAD